MAKRQKLDSDFSIEEDLEYREDSQKLEILSISGPSAPWVMKNLVDGSFEKITERFGISVNKKVAEKIVKNYSKMILG